VRPSVIFFLGILPGGDDEQDGIAKMLPVWELVPCHHHFEAFLLPPV